MPDDARRALADQQMKLMRAMTGDTTPAGFDEFRVSLAAKMLLHKRSRTVARCWPRLAAALESQYADLFSQYAKQQTKPASGGGISDGLLFLRFLKWQKNLPDEGKLEWLSYRSRRTYFGFTWLTQPPGIAVGITSHMLIARFQ